MRMDAVAVEGTRIVTMGLESDSGVPDMREMNPERITILKNIAPTLPPIA
jgi:hypothetical protein